MQKSLSIFNLIITKSHNLQNLLQTTLLRTLHDRNCSQSTHYSNNYFLKNFPEVVTNIILVLQNRIERHRQVKSPPLQTLVLICKSKHSELQNPHPYLYYLTVHMLNPPVLIQMKILNSVSHYTIGRQVEGEPWGHL